MTLSPKLAKLFNEQINNEMSSSYVYLAMSAWFEQTPYSGFASWMFNQSREETAQLAGRQEKFIKHLEDALLRIRNKTYGICRVTGRLISKERLRLVPHATLSIEAKQQMGS